jgi:radical SAM protein with 4Fe4S-binding SPASM domain
VRAVEAIASKLGHAGEVRRVHDRALLFLAGVPEVFGVDDEVARGDAIAIEGALRDADELRARGWLVAGRARPPTKTLALVLTTACNLACVYCNVSQGSYGRDAAFMTPGTIARALDVLLPAQEASDARDANVGATKIVFFGGEPLLAWDALVEGTKLARARRGDVTLAVVTNGTLIDDEKAVFLAQNGVEVTLSLDGDEETHDRHRRDHAGRGSHARAVAGVDALQRHGVRPFLRATYADGPSSVHARLRALDDIGRRHLPVIVERLDVPPDDDDFDDAMADTFARAVRHREAPDALVPFVDAVVRGAHGMDLACSAGRDVVVLPDGEIFPCHVSADARTDRVAALADAVESIVARRADVATRFGRVPDRCTTCFASGLCGRGCPMRTARGDEPTDRDCRWSIDRLDHAAYLADALPFDRLHDLLLSRAREADRTPLRAGLMMRDHLRGTGRRLWPISFPSTTR